MPQSIKGKKILSRKVVLLLIALASTICIVTLPASKKPSEEQILSIRKPHPDFVGRKAYLNQLKDALIPQPKKWSAQEATQVAVIWGKGGYGKTELAVKFANRNLSQFSLVWSFNCETKSNLYQSYRLLAKRLHVSGENDSFTTLKEKVHQYLEHHPASRPFLLIFDNVEREQVDYPKRGGCVLVTSQKKLVDEKVQIELNHFTQGEAIELLKMAGKNETSESVTQLAEALEYIPLLVNSAAHYIQATPNCNCSNYLDLLTLDDHHKENILWKVADANHRYFKTLSRSWQAPFNELKQDFPLAAEWLIICAYLNPENIPEKWFRGWVQAKLQLSAEDAFLEEKKLLKALIQYGLIHYDSQRQILSLHRFFQRIIRMKRRDLIAQDLALTTQLLSMYSSFYRYADKQTWEEGELWLVHALEMEKWLEKIPIVESLGQAFLFQGIGKWFIFHDRPKKGISAHQKALEIKKKVFPENHFEIGCTYQHLAWAKFWIEDLEEGLLDAIEAEKRVSLEEHPQMGAVGLNVKGLILYRLERYTEAISCHQKALEIRRELFGNVHIDIARSLNNIGVCLNHTQKYEQANQILEEAREAVQKTSGTHHPLYALMSENQCHSLIGLKRYREAIFRAGKALIIRQEALKQEHGDLVHGWMIIGNAFFHLGEISLARYSLQNVLNISNRFTEKNFRYQVLSRNLLGKCDVKEGKEEEGRRRFFDSVSLSYARRHVPLFRRSYRLLLEHFDGKRDILLSSFKMAQELLGDQDPLVEKTQEMLEQNFLLDHPLQHPKSQTCLK